MLEQALKYLDYGWSVIPLKGKKPRIKWKKYQKTKPSRSRVRKWWDRWPEANIGVVTGRVSGIIVVDIDKESALDELNIPKTLTVQTGGGGWHFYFKRPPKKHIRNAVKFLDGADIRADGGYVVAPPSTHESGGHYSFQHKRRPAALPRSIEMKIKQQSKEKEPLSAEDWEAEVEEGERDVQLTRRVGKLFQSGLPEQEVLTLARSWNKRHCEPPLPGAQVRKIVDSIARREKEGQKVDESGPQGFRVVGFDKALREYGLHEVRWHVEDWLPQNTVGMLVAPPGNYKTWLLLDLATATAVGRDFLGQIPVRNTGRVLILQQEDPFPLLFTRLAQIMNFGPVEQVEDGYKLYAPAERPEIFWHPDRKLSFSKPETLDGLEQAVEKIDPELVILDPLYSAGDTTDYLAEAATQMLRLKTMRDKYDCSFMIAHHTNKNSGGGRQAAWGSQFLNAWLETGWQIRPGKQDHTIKLKRHFKMAAEQKELQLSFTIDDYSYAVDISSTDDSDSDVESQIINMIKEGEELTSYRQISDAVGRSKTAVGRVLRNSEKIIKLNGKYKLRG